jgi:hypothetical protein
MEPAALVGCPHHEDPSTAGAIAVASAHGEVDELAPPCRGRGDCRARVHNSNGHRRRVAAAELDCLHRLSSDRSERDATVAGEARAGAAALTRVPLHRVGEPGSGRDPNHGSAISDVARGRRPRVGDIEDAAVRRNY